MEPSPEVAELRDRVRAFVDERVIPAEPRARRRRPRADALAAGRGQGRGPVGARACRRRSAAAGCLHAVRLRERGRRPLRARDDRARHALAQDATCCTCSAPTSRRSSGCSRSSPARSIPSIGMTEPEVAGSDPTRRATPRRCSTATSGSINAHKWFTTGAIDGGVHDRLRASPSPTRRRTAAFVDDHRADRHAGLRDRPRDPDDGRHLGRPLRDPPDATCACRRATCSARAGRRS